MWSGEIGHLWLDHHAERLPPFDQRDTFLDFIEWEDVGYELIRRDLAGSE